MLGVLLIQQPDLGTKTIHIEEVADRVWFVIEQDESETVVVVPEDNQNTSDLQDGRTDDE